MRICVVTSHEISEPRGPRHAIAVKRAFPHAEVIFLHYLSGSARAPAVCPLLDREPNIDRRILISPTRKSGPVEWAARKITRYLARVLYSFTGFVWQPLFGERTIGLTRALSRIPADMYFAHNFETLRPAALAAQRHNAELVFDCMEFYSDMGDGQPAEVSRAIAETEARYLPKCGLIVAASRELAKVYADTHKINLPLASYNVPPIEFTLPPRQGGALNLYWRNNVLGFGQRGLEDILNAMVLLTPDVHLYLQGNPGVDGGHALRRRIDELKISAKVSILPPHAPGGAVVSAARFDVGLCLERKGPRNHDLTVSNKMFDYHMAGLAVISSDLEGLAAVIQRSRGGVLYEPGNVTALYNAVQSLRSHPGRLAELQQNARAFALQVGNVEFEIDSIAAELTLLVGQPPQLEMVL